jgi:MoxR-like ATPase
VKTSEPEGGALPHKFAARCRERAEGVSDRDEEIVVVLTALVVRQHVLLGRPPGGAKSLLHRLRSCRSSRPTAAADA